MKHFKQSQGLDTVLYKNVPLPIFFFKYAILRILRILKRHNISVSWLVSLQKTWLTSANMCDIDMSLVKSVC